MKLTYLTIATLLSTVLAKNVVDLNSFKSNLEDQQDQLEKRKNVVDLLHDKRQPKNIVDLNKFKQPIKKDVINLEEFKIGKREAKNVFDLTKLQQHSQQGITKRQEEQQVLSNSKHMLFAVDDVDCYTNLLQSILPQIHSISVFAGYIRDNQVLYDKTEFINETMVIIAPTNTAIDSKLSGLKPWQFPNSLTDVKDELKQEELLQENLNSYLNGHIITNFESKLIIGNDDDVTVQQVIIAPLRNGKLVKIKQDSISDKFKVKLMEEREWIDVVLVKQVENGFVFVIEDSLVKP
ncbi:FAS1 domain-containing protein [Spathaspora sp. JA1]|nr:FAS1 domain-containing protein [Spathaspora sp. JA1]